MGTEHIYLIMKVFLASVLLSASVLLAEECPEMPPMVCADGDITCPMGMDEYGCPMRELWTALRCRTWSALMVTSPAQQELILWDALCLRCACPLEASVLPGELWIALRCPRWSALMVTSPARWELTQWDALCQNSVCLLEVPVLLGKN